MFSIVELVFDFPDKILRFCRQLLAAGIVEDIGLASVQITHFDKNDVYDCGFDVCSQ